MGSTLDRAAAAEEALIFYGLVKGQSGELASAPESVIADLLTDLMHYAEREDIDFRAALNIAMLNFTVESREVQPCAAQACLNHRRRS